MTTKSERQRENTESRRLVEAAFELARSLEITTLLVQADELQDVRLIERARNSERVIWLTRSGEFSAKSARDDAAIRLPETTLTRISQMKLGLLLAVLDGEVGLSESILGVSGVAGSRRLDTLLIMNPRRDFPWFQKHQVEAAQGAPATRELAGILEIAIRLAGEGREGKPIGTIFVLGEMEQLSPYLRQLVLNPCEGHPKKGRNIHDPRFFETIREFAALDGAFVVSTKGVVESAGTYLDAPVTKAKLASGLGARHAAAAAITAATDVIAVAVSGSSGMVSLFRGGEAILEFEKPTPRPQTAG